MFFKNSNVKFPTLRVLLYLDNLSMRLLKYKVLKKFNSAWDMAGVIKPKVQKLKGFNSFLNINLSLIFLNQHIVLSCTHLSTLKIIHISFSPS